MDRAQRAAIRRGLRRAEGKRPLWRPESVRARTTVGATLVVAVALVAAGLLVVTMLRDNLNGRAELTAEVNARSIAGALASGTAPSALELPDDDELAQVVDATGTVVAASDDLEGLAAVGDFAPNPHPSRPPTRRAVTTMRTTTTRTTPMTTTPRRPQATTRPRRKAAARSGRRSSPRR